MLRLPSLTLLAATWVLCRWVFSRLARRRALGALGARATFLAGALAGGMTLRRAGDRVLRRRRACPAFRFRERERHRAARSGNGARSFRDPRSPGGVLTLAPLLVSAPSIFRWARANVAVAGTLLVGTRALRGTRVRRLRSHPTPRRRPVDPPTGLMPTGGTSSCATRCSRTTRTEPRCHARSWPWSGSRCSRSSSDAGGTGSLVLDLPSASLGLMLVLQLATPSRHPFQFGALLGVLPPGRGGSQGRTPARRPRLDRLARVRSSCSPRRRSPQPGRRSPRPGWNPLDLRTLEWTLAVEDSLPLQSLAVGLPLLLPSPARSCDHAACCRDPWRVAVDRAGSRSR